MIEFEIKFNDQTALDRTAREGWGAAEAFGTWMTGPASRLVLPPPPRHDGTFELRAVIGPMLVPGRLDAQRIRISVNGIVVFETPMNRLWLVQCPVPAEAIAARGQIEIVIEHPDAASPSSLGTGADLRELSASIWSLTLLGSSPLPEQRARNFARPIFHTRPFGNLANRMIQHLVALSVQDQAPSCRITGTELAEWGITGRPEDGTWADLAITDEQRVDVAGIAALLESRTVTKIVHRGYGQRMENFLPRERYRDLFHSPDAADIAGYDERHLVINIRSGDVVAGTFLDYVLTPINFYRDLIAETGLIPVFVGQLEPNIYTDALRAAFPDAVYHEGQTPVRDFETVRRSSNIVVSVSTFSWLAAWLSEARQIFLPVNGLLNPLQFPKVDLIPLNDPRYRFFLFPINHANPDFAAAHQAIDGQWQEFTSAELQARLTVPSPVAEPDAEPPPRPAPAAAPITHSHTAPRGPSAPMLEDVRAIVAEAEAAAERGYAVDVLHHLRKLALVDYGELICTLPRDDLPHISRLLPAMAPEEAQLGWNGKSGAELRHHTVDFCRILAARFHEITGRPLHNTRILDFGCGWGRILRLLWWHTDPQNCCAVDAMPQAIDRCRTDRVPGRLVLSDYLPTDIDVGDRRYDLIFAYSVFTHTPLPVAQAVMSVLHRKLRAKGLLAITVRPVEFWEQSGTPDQVAAAMREHREIGFSYRSLGVVGANGQEIYGDTSISPAWLAANFPDWEVEGTDRGMDPMQMVVFLSPR